MNNKNIIIAGAIAVGLYLFSQTKKIQHTTAAQKVAQRTRSTATPTVRKRTAQKIAQKIAQKVAQKVVPKRIGQPTTQAARIAALRKAAARKAAVRKAAARKAAARKAAQKIKARRAAMARYAKKQRPQIQRPNMYKKQTTSKLFSGAEKSRIIPYSESSRHSYYGSKSHRLRNEGYGRGKAERDRKQALEFRLNELRTMFPRSNL